MRKYFLFIYSKIENMGEYLKHHFLSGTTGRELDSYRLIEILISTFFFFLLITNDILLKKSNNLTYTSKYKSPKEIGYVLRNFYTIIILRA